MAEVIFNAHGPWQDYYAGSEKDKANLRPGSILEHDGETGAIMATTSSHHLAPYLVAKLNNGENYPLAHEALTRALSAENPEEAQAIIEAALSRLVPPLDPDEAMQAYLREH